MKISSPANAAMNAITVKVIDVRNVNTPSSLVEAILNSPAKADIVGGLSRAHGLGQKPTFLRLCSRADRSRSLHAVDDGRFPLSVEYSFVGPVRVDMDKSENRAARRRQAVAFLVRARAMRHVDLNQPTLLPLSHIAVAF